MGVLVVLAIVIVGGAAAFAWESFSKPVPAINGAPVTTSATGAASAASTMQAAAQPAPGVTASEPPNGPSAPMPASAVPPAAIASSQSTASAQAAAPMDRSLQIATDLVRKGEQAYARGDYAVAIRSAHSALDVYPGHAGAERLLRRADAARQRRAAEQQQRQQQAQQAQQQAAAAALAKQRAAAAAALPPPPTPDQLYDQRAHSECARGLFGKACRHRIRQQVRAGASLTAPGANVCKALRD